MKRLIAGTLLGLVVVGGPATAFAGEVGGNGKPTPVASPPDGRFVAGSICAFNGLDDGSETDGVVTPGEVQSFGFLVADFVDEVDDRGASTFHQMIREEGPGTACHGFASQD